IDYRCRLRSPPPPLIITSIQQHDPDSGTGPGGTTAGPGGGRDQNSHCVPPTEDSLQPQPQLLQWHPVLRLSKGSDGSQDPQQGVPVLDSDPGSVLCHRHRLLTDRLAKWPPGLLDQALRVGLLEPRKNCPSGGEDPVLALARRLGQLGEGREGGGGEDTVLPLSRCSCHSVLAPGPGGMGPGEDPSETSDALLVLEGLGSEEVGGLGRGGDGQEADKGDVGGVGGLPGGAGRRGSAPTKPAAPRWPSSPPMAPPPAPTRLSAPRLEGEKTPRGKSRKGGSLKIRLSKLFRTKSSSGGSGALLDKRPSLASSTSSGGSLLDVWGSTCSNTDQDSSRPHSAFSPVPFTPAFTGETVSLVDVDISRRGGSSLHPPTPPPPPRRSLSLLDTFLRGLPRPVPLRPDGHPPPRLAPRCPLSRPDAGSFATSLRELEKCGWYWGPMNWEDAEMKLKGKPDGSFLVRDSSDPRYILSLSFRSQGVTHHTRMEHYRGTFSLWCHPKFEDRCHSVVEFIERAIMHSKNGKFLYFLRSRVPGLPPTPVQLLYPVSRFSSVKSLQHLCRFCIRQLVRIDHIQELPLPTPLIAYLRKFYYYDPEEEISPTLNELKEPREVKEPSPDQSSQLGVESQT
uniref:Suppressor of cytokine signaling 7 n=1 Tax=Amphiprion ocellaris TaxID=80972 RepID=A0A3Q1C7K7_AMPOC